MENDGFDLVIYAYANFTNSDMPTATVTVDVGEDGNTAIKTITVYQNGKQEVPDPEKPRVLPQMEVPSSSMTCRLSFLMADSRKMRM